MAIHSSHMTLVVPVGHPTTMDMIDFRIRPQLGQWGIQTWGLTRQTSPTTYAFRIEVEGLHWQAVTDNLAAARQWMLAQHGLKVVL